MAIDHEKYPHALPDGTILTGEFIIDSVLGEGGFGITYGAVNHKTKERVAIKEYFPDTMATRIDPTRVAPYSGDRGANFEYGKECFLQEARTLAEFIGNDNIVRIFSYFEENGTAYFAMEYVEGTSFDKYIAGQGGRLSFTDTCRILFPVMDALSAVHEKGIIHRDISPDNIYITADGGIRLLDFGAARYSLGDRSCSLDVVLKPGYAPKEQYTRRGRQGPYTDIYALGATFYYALTGKRPLSSIDRLDEDDLARPSALGADIGPTTELALLQALELRSQDRYQSMNAFKQALVDAEQIDHPPDAGNINTSEVTTADTAASAPESSVPVPSSESTDTSVPSDIAAVYASAPGGNAQPYDIPVPAENAQTFDVPAPAEGTGPYVPPAAAPEAPRKKKHGAGFYTAIAAAILLPLLVVGGLFAFGVFSSTDDADGLSGLRGRGQAEDTDTENNGRSADSGDDGNGLFPTGRDSDENGDPTPSDDEGPVTYDQILTIGIINNPPAESGYREANESDLETVFSKERGYILKTAFSYKNDEQLQAAQGFITEGVDYLLVSPAESTGWEDVLLKAKEAGIKVCLFDREIDVDESLYEASFVNDMYEEGRTAVNWLLSQGLPEYNVIHLQGAKGSAAQLGRSAALDAHAASGDIHLVVQQTATWDEAEAKQIVESVIKSGDRFNVIYAENDGMAKGAVAALDEAGITHGVGGDVLIISFDCNKWALRELLSGQWNFDVQCSPFYGSAIEKLIRSGETPSSKRIVIEDKGFEAGMITQKDVDTYGLGN